MIKTCKKCGEKFETNNKHRGRCDKCMDNNAILEQSIKKSKQDKDMIITPMPFLDINTLNEIFKRNNPILFFDPLDFYFKKCDHGFLIIPYLSNKGFEVDVFNHEKKFCEDCNKKIREIVKDLGNAMKKSMEDLKNAR